MAPTTSSPSDLKFILNPARRTALTILTGSVIAHMRSQIASLCDSLPRSSINSNSSRPHPERKPSGPRLQELQREALRYFEAWQESVITALGRLINAPEDPRASQKRREWAARIPPPPYTASEATPTNLLDTDLEDESIAALQRHYRPLPTRLTTIPRQDRIGTLSCMILILLSLGHYSAHSRVLLLYLTSSLALPLSVLSSEETEIARTLLLASKALSADAEAQKRRDENANSRKWKVGFAAVGGAALIGITGGLAAPIVAGAIGGLMGGVGLGGLASFLGIFAMNGALVGTLFGAYGAKMTGTMVDNYAKDVEDFKFLPVKEECGEAMSEEEEELRDRKLRVTIGINGWLTETDDVSKPWKVLGADSEVFALRYEMDTLLALGNSLKTMVSSTTWSFVKMEILRRTVLATLWSALWPVYLLKMAATVDNPFAVARNRSEKAGEVLADALINRAQGERPVTLVGYSLGARVIYSCLRSLAERKAFGLVESVVFLGAPVPSSTENWKIMRSVVSGKMINVFSENDYILAFLYRATSIQFGIAGLQKIEAVEGVENLDISKEVSGHLRYPDLIGKILARCGFEGIKVEDQTIEEEHVPEASLIDFSDAKAQDESKDIMEGSRQSLMTSEVLFELDADVAEPQTTGASKSTTATRHHDDDSDDEGGIQMVDNDEEELQEIECVPEVDHEDIPEPESRDSSKLVLVEDQKFLGSFPRTKKVTASDMGLY